MVSNRSSLERVAFTIVELLVVIAVIAILVAVLIPVLGIAKEKSRRVVCQSNIHQFALATHIYANSNNDRLPSGLSDNSNPEDEHTPVLSRDMRDQLVNILGNADSLKCQWLGEPFTEPDGWYYQDYGYVLGYNYLGGHKGTPWAVIGLANAEWKSPKTSNEYSGMELVTELNSWTLSEGKTFAPHGKRGAILEGRNSTNSSQGGVPSQQIGAEGGNVGMLDGSVSWKKISDMKIYRSSRDYDADGCFSAW
jgi:type II secretory pathway pseudopilin PulG